MTNINERRNHKIGGDYIKTHQNHIDAVSKILKHMKVSEKHYGGAEWAEQGGILKSEVYSPSNKTKIVLHTHGDKHHVAVENVLKKSTYHSYDTEYHPEDKDKTQTVYSTTPNKPEFSWDHISDEYFSHAPDMDKWGKFSSEFSKAKSAVEKNEKTKETNMTNITESHVYIVDKHGNHQVVPMDVAGGHKHTEDPTFEAFRYAKSILKNVKKSGGRVFVRHSQGVNELKETHNLPAFSDAAQNDKKITDLLKKHGKLTTDDDSYLTDHYHKQYLIQHPNNKNHTLMVHHTIDTDGKQSQMVHGVRYSNKTDNLLGFVHTNNDKEVKTNHQMTKDDAFDDNYHHLKKYLENDWKKVGTMNESYDLVENTKRVLPDNLMTGYTKFISKQNSYNNLGVIQEEKVVIKPHKSMNIPKKTTAQLRKDNGNGTVEVKFDDGQILDINKKYVVLNEGIFDIHQPDSMGSYDTDPHETEAAFGHTLNRFREAGGNKWDLHIKGSHGRRIGGQSLTRLGQKTQWLTGAKAVPYKSTGTLIATFQHKENPDHKIDFALGRDGKGGTKIINAHHNMSGSSISNASPADMEQFMGKLTRTAKGFQGLTEGEVPPHWGGYVKLHDDKKSLEKILKKHNYHYSSSDSMMMKGEYFHQHFYEHGKEPTAIYLNSKIDKNGKTKHHFEVYDRDGGNHLYSSVPQNDINDVSKHLENWLKQVTVSNKTY